MSNVIRLTIAKVAQYLDTTVDTIENWYAWYRNPEYEKPYDTPELPPYGKDETRRQCRYWYSDDLDKLARFQSWLHNEGRGAMSAFNRARYWKHTYRKYKEPGKFQKNKDQKIRDMHEAYKSKSIPVNRNEIKMRTNMSERFGYPKPKYLEFCEELLEKGFEIRMYEAQKTVSKYIYIIKGEHCYKVRFSNHKPNFKKESDKDCDFFVGVTNYTVTTTKQALEAVYKYFGLRSD